MLPASALSLVFTRKDACYRQNRRKTVPLAGFDDCKEVLESSINQALGQNRVHIMGPVINADYWSTGSDASVLLSLVSLRWWGSREIRVRLLFCKVSELSFISRSLSGTLIGPDLFYLFLILTRGYFFH